MRNDAALIADHGTQGKVDRAPEPIRRPQARLNGIPGPIQVMPISSSWGVIRDRDLLWLASTREKANQRAIEFGASAGLQVRTARP